MARMTTAGAGTPHGTNKWTALAVTTVGVFMVFLDTRVMIVGLPQIAKSLGADAEEAIWFTQSFQMMITVCLLIVGRISDMLGRARVYTSGFALFTVGSALVSFAQSPFQVILFRGIQGLGGSIITTVGIALITDSASKNDLGFAIGINQIASRLGAMVGLTVSGIILSFFDWRALFYINIPIGIFGTIWSQRRLRDFAKPRTGERMDWVGFITFTSSIASLLLALTFAAYGLETLMTVIIGLFSLFVVSIGVFIYNESRVRNPLVDLRLFRVRELSGGFLALTMNSLAFGGVLVSVSLFFQLIQGYSPLSAGLAIIPFDVAFIIVAPISGRLADKHGYAVLTTLGLVFTSTGLFLLSAASSSAPFAFVVVCLAFLGAGVGTFTSPNTSSIMKTVPPARRGVVSGMRSTFFNTGYTTSLNIIILVMTFNIPYAIVTGVISSGGEALPPAYTSLFASGLREVFFWFGVLNSIALIPSIFRRKISLRRGGRRGTDGLAPAQGEHSGPEGSEALDAA